MRGWMRWKSPSLAPHNDSGMLVFPEDMTHILAMDRWNLDANMLPAFVDDTLRNEPSDAVRDSIEKTMHGVLLPYLYAILDQQLSRSNHHLSQSCAAELVTGGVAEHILRSTLHARFSQQNGGGESGWLRWPEERTVVNDIRYKPANNGQSTLVSFKNQNEYRVKEIDASYLHDSGQLLFFEVTTSQKILEKRMRMSHEIFRYRTLLQELLRRAMPAHVCHVVINRPENRFSWPRNDAYPSCSVHLWPIRAYVESVANKACHLLHQRHPHG